MIPVATVHDAVLAVAVIVDHHDAMVTEAAVRRPTTRDPVAGCVIMTAVVTLPGLTIPDATCMNDLLGANNAGCQHEKQWNCQTIQLDDRAPSRLSLPVWACGTRTQSPGAGPYYKGAQCAAIQSALKGWSPPSGSSVCCHFVCVVKIYSVFSC